MVDDIAERSGLFCQQTVSYHSSSSPEELPVIPSFLQIFPKRISCFLFNFIFFPFYELLFVHFLQHYERYYERY